MMPKATEAQIHKAILHELRLKLPRGSIVHHSPNEVSASGANIAIAISKAKGMGMVTGWPDLEIMLPGGRIVFLEVKRHDGQISKAQAETIGRLSSLGFRVGVVRSVVEAMMFLEDCGAFGAPDPLPLSAAAQTVRDAVSRASNETGITAAEIASGDRRREVLNARWLAMSYARAAGLSLPSIGRAMGLDHSTVAHGLARLQEVTK